MESDIVTCRTAENATGCPRRPPRSGAPAVTSGCRGSLRPATRDFADIAEKSSVPVLVDLWATWCGPCRMVSPALEQLATERAGQLKLVKVDVDKAPAISQRFTVQAVPTLLLLDHGQILARQAGAAPRCGAAQFFETRRCRPAARRRHGHDIGGYRSTRGGDPPGAPAHERLRGMPAARRTVGPLAAVPDVPSMSAAATRHRCGMPERAHGGPPDRAVIDWDRRGVGATSMRTMSEVAIDQRESRRWPKPPTSTARTRDCPTIRLPPSRQAAPGAPSKRARRLSARVSAPTTSSSFCPARSPSPRPTTRAIGT